MDPIIIEQMIQKASIRRHSAAQAKNSDSNRVNCINLKSNINIILDNPSNNLKVFFDNIKIIIEKNINELVAFPEGLLELITEFNTTKLIFKQRPLLNNIIDVLCSDINSQILIRNLVQFVNDFSLKTAPAQKPDPAPATQQKPTPAPKPAKPAPKPAPKTEPKQYKTKIVTTTHSYQENEEGRLKYNDKERLNCKETDVYEWLTCTNYDNESGFVLKAHTNFDKESALYGGYKIHKQKLHKSHKNKSHKNKLQKLRKHKTHKNKLY